MAMKNPQEVAAKWARRLSQSTQDIIDGVNSVTENPATQAIAKQDKMVQNYLESINNGKWAANLGKVTLSDWKRAMLEKGVPRIASGATAATPKMAAFMSELLPFIDGLQVQVDQMPDLTLEDSINRMTFFIRGMTEFRQ